MNVERTFRLDTKVAAWRNLTQNDLMVVSLGSFVVWKIVETLVGDMFLRYFAIIVAIYGWYRLYTFIGENLPSNIAINFLGFISESDKYTHATDTHYIPVVVPNLIENQIMKPQKTIDQPRTLTTKLNS